MWNMEHMRVQLLWSLERLGKTNASVMTLSLFITLMDDSSEKSCGDIGLIFNLLTSACFTPYFPVQIILLMSSTNWYLFTVQLYLFLLQLL